MSDIDIKPGEQLSLAQINRILKQRAAAGKEPEAGGKPSDGLKVEELKAALEAKGIAIPEGAKKADLAELLDNAPA